MDYLPLIAPAVNVPAVEPQSPASSPPQPPQGVAQWRLWAHFLLIIPLPPLIGLMGMGRHEHHQSALSNNVTGLLWTSFINIVVFGLIFGLAVWASKANRDDLLLRLRRPWMGIPAGFAYSVAIRIGIVMCAGGLAAIVILTKLMTPTQLQELAAQNRPDLSTVLDLNAQKDNPLYYWLTLTLVSFVVAGLREELWRCAALASLRQLWPRWFGLESGGQIRAVVVTSILFGLAHAPMGGIAIGATGVIGLMLGAIMVGHRSIWPAVIAHGAFDATTFAMLPFLSNFIKPGH